MFLWVTSRLVSLLVSVAMRMVSCLHWIKGILPGCTLLLPSFFWLYQPVRPARHQSRMFSEVEGTWKDCDPIFDDKFVLFVEILYCAWSSCCPFIHMPFSLVVCTTYISSNLFYTCMYMYICYHADLCASNKTEENIESLVKAVVLKDFVIPAG